MTVNLAGAVEAFAAARSARLDEKDEELRPLVEAALAARRAGDTEWAAELAIAAGVLWAETYEAEGGQAEPGNVDVFVERLTTNLDATSDVPFSQREAQIERVTFWVAVFTLNDATTTAAAEDPELVLRWVTMRDEDVRATHAALEGQTIIPGGTFDVNGNALHYPGEPVGPPDIWINCRCMAMPVSGGEMSTLTAATTPGQVPVEDPVEVVDEPAVPPEWDDEMEIEVPWHGILAVEGIPTGDLRRFASQALTFDQFPLSLTWQRASADRHDGSVVIGRITNAWTDTDGLVRGEGMFRISPEANEVVDMIANGDIRGVSVELDSVAMEYSDVDGNPIDIQTVGETEIYQHLTAGRVRSATVLPVPAFAESYVALGPWPEGEGQDAAALAAAGPADTHDGPGWVTNPDETQQLRTYWTTGEGAAKIRWGTDGDFNRCRRQLAKYVPNPDYLAGTCANLHYVALGVWPGREAASASLVVSEAGVLAASGVALETEEVATSPAPNLADPAELPRAEWFRDPGLPMPTPITIIQDKDTGRYRLVGHAAAWGVCHIGLGLSVGQEGCTVAPHSETNYAHYRVGAVETDEGLVPIGRITMGTGHAGANLGAAPAAEHYDNTGTVVADVAAGEDEHGIWLAGLLRPGVTAEQRAELLAATISGDWRWIGGNLEMVATLAVNTPGFPIPRLSVAASGGRQTTLFAAGIVPARVNVVEEGYEAMVLSAVDVARELHRLAKVDAAAKAAREAIAEVRKGFNSERAAKALSAITSGK